MFIPRARSPRRKAHAPLLLESLETRALLSAVIALSGNGTTINSGESSPSAADFTDFGYMSTTINAAIGRVTRTYTISNAGDAGLSLSGTPVVQVNGDDAADFIVTVEPSTTLAISDQATFTIAFVPTAAGVRSATVTLASNDPNTPLFSFDIQGTGVVTTNATDNLQIATTVAGTGTGAINGTLLTVNYTGTLLNGSVFDSSLNPGRGPFQLQLGAGSVITGWQEGLQGIKAGESRVLIIPAALAYGSQAQNGIPANSPLIFTVDALSLDLPTVAVTGNSITIPFGDTTPAAADGTFLGTTPVGDKTPLTFTFHVANANNGSISFPQTPAVTLSGSGTTNFTTTDITVSTGGSFATFTVTYTPTLAGTQTATVHVLTNDATHPDFTFNVAATYTPSTVPKIQVTGNGVTIANGDTTPQLADFTDFSYMSTTVRAAIGKVTRSYLISNTGDVDLTLSGNPVVSVSGANRTDFVVASTSAGTIPAGMQSGFSIIFTPHGSGLRKATVTILTNDPAAPTFTFNIQGTGLATTNQTDGLQIATVAKGFGPAAVTGTNLNIDYTGFLLNGTVFDSSLQSGRTPLAVTLGQHSVINGWEQGLLGIKDGERRVLLIPASLGYGASANGNIPANSTLIFTVEAKYPIVAISGGSTSVPIVFNDTTPNASDGTFLGATPIGSSAALTSTFKLTNGGAGSLGFSASPAAAVVNKNGAHFSTTDITIDPSGQFASFTVTFTPTKPGTQSAVVHVFTTDPLHSDFTFTVSATYTPFVDLKTVSIGTIAYPASANITSGAATNYTIPVKITNLGDVAIAGNTPAILFNFYLHDTTTNVDTLIASRGRTDLRGLGAGQSRTVGIPIPVPITIPTDAYEMLVKVNENALVPETNYSNNSATSSQIVNITQGFFNVNGTLGASTYPVTIVNSTKLAGKLTTVIRNAGNLTLPAGQKFTLQTIAHDTDTNADVILGTSTLTLGGWTANRTGSFSVSSSLLAGLPAGNYVLRSQLTPVQPLDESSTGDNLIATNGGGVNIPLTVT